MQSSARRGRGSAGAARRRWVRERTAVKRRTEEPARGGLNTPASYERARAWAPAAKPARARFPFPHQPARARFPPHHQPARARSLTKPARARTGQSRRLRGARGSPPPPPPRFPAGVSEPGAGPRGVSRGEPRDPQSPALQARRFFLGGSPSGQRDLTSGGVGAAGAAGDKSRGAGWGGGARCQRRPAPTPPPRPPPGNLCECGRRCLDPDPDPDPPTCCMGSRNGGIPRETRACTHARAPPSWGGPFSGVLG